MRILKLILAVLSLPLVFIMVLIAYLWTNLVYVGTDAMNLDEIMPFYMDCASGLKELYNE